MQVVHPYYSIDTPRYHVLSNLLGMLRNSFVALSSKQNFLDFLEDAHVPMPDISGYIRERVKQYTWVPKCTLR